MTLAPPAAEAQAAGLPPLFPQLLLPPELRLTPEQFALVCDANPEAVLELAADGRMITMTPTGGETSSRNSRLLTRLQNCADRQGGWIVFDSSGGFRLNDGSVLSPEQRRFFPPLCPDLVIELTSPSDQGPRGVTALRRKMAVYMAKGARLGWLLFPGQRAAEIWQAGGDRTAPVEPLRIEPALALENDAVLPGLRLELAEIWAS
jgi:Uma2 family endonuclease